MRFESFHDFAVANKARCESPNGFNHKLDDWSLSDWMTALTGEVGEAANIIKKLNRYRDGFRGNTLSETELKTNLKKELGDVFVYLDLLCQLIGTTVEEAANEVFEAKSKQIGYQP